MPPFFMVVQHDHNRDHHGHGSLIAHKITFDYNRIDAMIMAYAGRILQSWGE
jgi:hypothetical protein